jgi:hypothetical protein
MLPRIRLQRITTRIQIVYNRIGDVMVSVLASSADLIVIIIIIIIIKLISSRYDLAEKLLSHGW